MSIHQEAIIGAAPREVYAVLTEGEKFAAATGMPATIGAIEGERFAVFGGRIDGRTVELVPGERVVQAWRFGDEHPDTWEAGVFSVVRFGLAAHADGTRLRIDHDAIPAEWQEHIEGGYPTFYRDPLVKYFAAA